MGRKLTPRQRAARKARATRGPLSAEARERLREAAIARRPWEHSTGPRTAEGKSWSRLNAIRDGYRINGSLPAWVREALSDLRAAELAGTPPADPARLDKALMWMMVHPITAVALRSAALYLRVVKLERRTAGFDA